MFCGKGMGGGSGGGGGVLRTVGRAVTRVGVSGNGIQDPISSSTAPTTTTATTTKSNSSSGSNSPTSKFARKPKSPSHLSLSSPVNSHKNPVSALPIWYSSPEGDDFDWVSVDGIEDESFHGFSDTYVWGNVPSEDEVEDAVYALQQVFSPTSHVHLSKDNCGLNNDVADHVTIPGFHVSTDGSEMDWKEPSLSPCDSRMRLSNGSDRVYYAFHLLQTEPSVQRMVKSLSSDKAVWDAVLNNEVVRELRESFSSDEEKVPQIPDGTSRSDSHSTTNVVMWIFDSARAKFKEVIEKITKIVNELFQPAVHKKDEDADFPDPFSERLRTSFMLSIMVLLVVVVSRAQRA